MHGAKTIVSFILLLAAFSNSASTSALAAIPASQEATLLFVTTPGCVPCQQFAPVVQEIAALGYSVETIDAAQQPELVYNQLQVRQFPTFLMLSHDRIVDRVVPNAGPVNMKPRILKMFDMRAPVPQAENGVPEIQQNCLASSVKLRVDADNTHSWGTGTIIDTRQGQALILTCGHIFRDSKGAGKIEVQLFGENSSVSVLGRCLFYDLEIDLALIVIAPPCPVKAAPLISAQLQLAPNQPVLSVGCDGGANPTLRTHTIRSLDRIGTPTENAVPFHYIQVSGAPVSGRSGGGLFTEQGQLIGVCNTADPVENDGHFVPPHIIRYVLQKMQLAAIAENPSLVDTSQAEAANVVQTVRVETSPLRPLSNTNADAAAHSDLAGWQEVQEKAVSQSDIHEATLEEIRRRAQDGDEIIVFIKSRRNPEIPGDVIRLNDAHATPLLSETSTGRDNVILSSGPMPVSHSVAH